MSTNDETVELGITEADRRKMGEILQENKKHGQRRAIAVFGLDGDAVATALDRCPDTFTAAEKLVTAWVFENGTATAREAADAAGVNYVTAKAALDGLVDAGVAHTNSQRTFEGRGRNPTVYVPCPDGVPPTYR